MKAFIFAALSAFSPACGTVQAGVIDFTYKYTFADGGWITGSLSGSLPGSPELPMESVEASGHPFVYHFPDGVTTYSNGFDGSFIDPVIPANGSVDGLEFDFFYDGGELENGMEGDAYFTAQGGFISLFAGEVEEPSLNGEALRPGFWEISWDCAVPDTGSTLALLGSGILGLAGVKRLQRRRQEGVPRPRGAFQAVTAGDAPGGVSRPPPP